MSGLLKKLLSTVDGLIALHELHSDTFDGVTTYPGVSTATGIVLRGDLGSPSSVEGIGRSPLTKPSLELLPTLRFGNTPEYGQSMV